MPIKVRGKRIAESHWTAIADDPALIENVWETGQVTLIERLKTIELHDISFDAEEVTDVIEHWATAPTKKSLVTTGRPTAEWWSDFTVELVDIFYTTSIGPNITTNALLDRVLERMTKAGHSKIPDTRSIRETVEKVLKRSREN